MHSSYGQFEPTPAWRECADRHTTLYHLSGKKPPTAPLPLGDEGGYKGLYDQVIKTLGTKYPALCGGTEGAVLYAFFPIFKASESSGKKGYWRRYLHRAPGTEIVWSEALPLRCRIKPWIKIAVPPLLAAKVSAVPYVLLYPFGWSTWISVRVTADHAVTELRQIVEYLAEGKAFTASGEKGSFTVSEIFDLVSRGVRSDAFGGKATVDIESSDTAIVTTVLSKSGPSLSLSGLSEEDKDEEQIRHIARPGNLQSNRPLQEMVTPLDADTARNYMVLDKLGRFTWMEKLLIPEGRNRQLLACYHSNSFLALVQAWHFEGLLEAGAKASSKSARVKPLLTRAAACLDKPPFHNASVVGLTKKPGA
jgi:hypothetical protein